MRICPKHGVDSCLEAHGCQMQPSLFKNLPLRAVLPALAKLKVSTRESECAAPVRAKPADRTSIMNLHQDQLSRNVIKTFNLNTSVVAGQTSCPPRPCHPERSGRPRLPEVASTLHYACVHCGTATVKGALAIARISSMQELAPITWEAADQLWTCQGQSSMRTARECLSHLCLDGVYIGRIYRACIRMQDSHRGIYIS